MFIYSYIYKYNANQTKGIANIVLLKTKHAIRNNNKISKLFVFSAKIVFITEMMMIKLYTK